jgi:formylglycine-generating enzyme required for sulfatase activity
VSGAVGSNILPGTSLLIVWDSGVEFPGFSSTTCRLRVTADDAANPDDLVYISPGTFTMGCPVDEPGYELGETQHQVTLTHGFFIQATEVTNLRYMEMAQWAYDRGYVTATTTSIGDNLDGSTRELLDLGGSSCEIDFSAGVFACVNPDHPAKYLTWYGSAAYCDWLSLQQSLPRAYDHGTWQCNGGSPYTAAGYRLPTEAEWEYACRAGSTTAFANGPIIESPYDCYPVDPNLDQMGWYCGNAGGWTSPVGQKMPNAWGLYDMHGNVFEWCNDWIDGYAGDVTDPVGPGTGDSRVLRGGDWGHIPLLCRSAYRGGAHPDYAYGSFGLRSVRASD